MNVSETGTYDDYTVIMNEVKRLQNEMDSFIVMIRNNVNAYAYKTILKGYKECISILLNSLNEISN